MTCTLVPLIACRGRADRGHMTLAPLFEAIVVGVDGRQSGRDALRLGQRRADAGGGEFVAVGVSPYQYRPP